MIIQDTDFFHILAGGCLKLKSVHVLSVVVPCEMAWAFELDRGTAHRGTTYPSLAVGIIRSVLQLHRDLQDWWLADLLSSAAGFRAEDLLLQKAFCLEAIAHVDLSAAGAVPCSSYQ